MWRQISFNDLLTKTPEMPFTNCKIAFDLLKLSLIYYHMLLFQFFQMSKTLESSPNALINKKVLDRYLTLELPENKIQATYIWIDGTDQNIRCKDRTLDFVPKSAKGKLITKHRIKTNRKKKLDKKQPKHDENSASEGRGNA